MARKKTSHGPTKKAKASPQKPAPAGKAASSRRRKPAQPKRAAPAKSNISAWEDDPGSGGGPITVPAPTLSTPPLAISIEGPAVPPGMYPIGSSRFRYWAAGEALRRAADFWTAIVPSGTAWHTGKTLPIHLDRGEDMNAYYDRQGLSFFHATAHSQTVYSGESPDVVCHELGHAVLDALRPDLWDSASDEIAAFHESFGDMSALLSTLQVTSLRVQVVNQTGGRLYRSTRLSRLAEQLGAAIRSIRPDAVDPDCLRNAVNSFFYHDPLTLPPSGPAGTLSSEPHSFSRVFTGGFFEALAGMALVAEPTGPTPDGLLQVSQEAGRLLVDAAAAASLVPDFYSQVAAGMVAADASRFHGKYGDTIKSAFVRRGILSLEGAAALSTAHPAGSALPTRVALAGVSAGSAAAAPPGRVALSGTKFGLGVGALLVHAASEPKRFLVMPAALGPGPLTAPTHDEAAEGYVADLFRRGRVEIGSHGDPRARVVHPLSQKTHQVVKEPQGLALVRVKFDCGFGSQLGG